MRTLGVFCAAFVIVMILGFIAMEGGIDGLLGGLT